MPKRISKDSVYDENGKRRFHGAFTGGFAAGYFNSVGTEEGWTPTAFISTRDQRVNFVQKTKEDFMDKEDNPLVGKLETQNLFAESKSFSTHQSTSRVAEKARTVNDILRTRRHYYGIGYKPIKGLYSSGLMLNDEQPNVMRMGDVLKGSTVNSSRFGLGALEDDDDEDIYATNQMSRYDRVLDNSVYRLKDREEDEQHSHHRNHHSSSKPSEIDGFVYSKERDSKKKSEGIIYPPPRVPSHFHEHHRWDRPLSWDWVVVKGMVIIIIIIIKSMKRRFKIT